VRYLTLLVTNSACFGHAAKVDLVTAVADATQVGWPAWPTACGGPRSSSYVLLRALILTTDFFCHTLWADL
jgi:hypothetical protein